MREGDVVLTPVPQANGVIKNRPAIILREMPPYKDLLVCRSSTLVHPEVRGFDELVSSSGKSLTSRSLQLTAQAHRLSTFLAGPKACPEYAGLETPESPLTPICLLRLDT